MQRKATMLSKDGFYTFFYGQKVGNSDAPFLLNIRSSNAFIITTISIAVFTDIFLYSLVVRKSYSHINLLFFPHGELKAEKLSREPEYTFVIGVDSSALKPPIEHREKSMLI